MWARRQAYGSNCIYNSETNRNGSRIANYATTAMVVRDMVEILEKHGQWREEQAKADIAESSTVMSEVQQASILARTRYVAGEEPLSYWGFSYGTVLGATLAAMQPHRAKRLVLDGVSDAEDYFHTGWTTNLQDTDSVMEVFFESCARAGPERCPMHPDHTTNGASATTIQHLWDSVETCVRDKGPISVPATALRGPEIITVSDIRQLVFDSLYKPLLKFETMANVMGPLALRGNGSAFADWKHERRISTSTPTCEYLDPENPACNQGGSEPGPMVLCSEGDTGIYTNITQHQFITYWKELVHQSKYFGDRWATIRLGCTGWLGRGTWTYDGPLASNATGENPILWLGNTLDPVTPLRNAFKMAGRYNGSVVLQADIEGHCSISNPSLCVGKAVRAFFQTGAVPENGTVCLPHRRPLVGTGTSRIAPLPTPMSRDDEILLAALESAAMPS